VRQIVDDPLVACVSVAWYAPRIAVYRGALRSSYGAAMNCRERAHLSSSHRASSRVELPCTRALRVVAPHVVAPHVVALHVVALCVVALCVGPLVLAGCADRVELHATTIEGLAQEAVEYGLPGVILLVDVAGEERVGVAGRGNGTRGARMRSTDAFRIASNSKMYIGLTTAILHMEGVVDIESPAASYLPSEVVERIENADQVTIRQLLDHTSGIYDYLDNDAFYDAVDDDPSRRWTEADAIVYAYDRRAYFAPGRGWEYSNSNYLLVGMIIDSVTGAHHSATIRARILEPLGLIHTVYEHVESFGFTFVHGYQEIARGYRNTHAYDFGYGLADGGIIASAQDLAAFIRAIGTRDARLPVAAIDLMFSRMQGPESERYGLGIGVEPHPSGELLLHGGNVPGYASEVFYQPSTDTVLVVFANGTDGKMDDIFDALVERALEIAFD